MILEERNQNHLTVKRQQMIGVTDCSYAFPDVFRWYLNPSKEKLHQKQHHMLHIEFT